MRYCLADVLDNEVQTVLEKGDHRKVQDSAIEKLVTIGELVDRLTIVNKRLWELKDAVANSNDDLFKSEAAQKDIDLVLERSIVKAAITDKIVHMVRRAVIQYESQNLGENYQDPDSRNEHKKYGD